MEYVRVLVIHSHQMGLRLVLCLRSADRLLKMQFSLVFESSLYEGLWSDEMSSVQSIVREQNVQSTTHDVGNCY